MGWNMNHVDLRPDGSNGKQLKDADRGNKIATVVLAIALFSVIALLVIGLFG